MPPSAWLPRASQKTDTWADVLVLEKVVDVLKDIRRNTWRSGF
jgi:hypothetical protein